MDSGEVCIAAINCRLFDLTAFTNDPETMETIVREDESFGFKVTVEFGRSGAIAFLPLAPWIRVHFFAQPLGLGKKVALGHATEKAAAGQLIYQPILRIPGGPAEVGLEAEAIYKITALLQVGAISYPAFIHGFLEGFTLQVYQ